MLAGLALAAVSYVAAVWLHQWELSISGSAAPFLPLSAMLERIALEHRLTLGPWLIAVALAGWLVGRLLDGQLRRRAAVERVPIIDDLTCAYSDCWFKRALQRDIARLHRSRLELSVLLIELDDFEDYTAARGRSAGNDALRCAADTLTASVREADLIARCGEAEFAVLAAGADERGAGVLAQKLRAGLDRAVPLRATVGVATFGKDGRGAHDLIAAADLALGRARRDGQDRFSAG